MEAPTTDAKPTPVIWVLREGAWQSVVSDLFTLGMLGALPWFNYRYCGGSAWIYAAIAIGWFVGIIARASGKTKDARLSPAEARAYLDKHFPISGAQSDRAART